MKKIMLSTTLSLLVLLAACSGKTPYHKTPMPDPKTFKAHFGDMDANGDDRVDWDEFKTYFPHAEPKVFNAIDGNGDNSIDHDEWHAFKEAHGLKDHD